MQYPDFGRCASLCAKSMSDVHNTNILSNDHGFRPQQFSRVRVLTGQLDFSSLTSPKSRNLQCEFNFQLSNLT